MEKLYTSKAFLKMAGGRMHTFHPTHLDPPLVISYRNHQKSLAYFSPLASLVLFFFIKKAESKGGTMAQCPPKYVPAGTCHKKLWRMLQTYWARTCHKNMRHMPQKGKTHASQHSLTQIAYAYAPDKVIVVGNTEQVGSIWVNHCHNHDLIFTFRAS